MDSTTLMTPDEAGKFRAGWNTDVKLLSRLTATRLREIDATELASQGRTRIVGKLSKDELINDILELRGFTTAKLNEAIHVLHHGEYPNSACEWCQS